MTVIMGVVVILAVIGIVVGISVFGPVAALAVPGLITLSMFAAEPFLGLLSIVFPLAFEDSLLLGGATVTRLLGLGLAVVWLFRKLLRRESWSSVVNAGLLVVVLMFFGWAMLSTIWSEYEIRAVGQFLRLGMLVALCVLVIDLVTSWIRVEWVARLLVLGGVIGAGLTVLQYFGFGFRRAGEAVAGGVNATAAILLTIIPFSFYLMRRNGNVVWRFVGLAQLTLAVLAIAVTFSRMAFLMLPLILLAELLQSFRRGRGSLRWILLGGAAVPIVLAIAPIEEIVSRVETIAPYIDSTLQGGGGNEETSGRGYHLRVALEVFRDHPVIGVGYQNFGYHFMNYYQHEVSGKEKLYLSPRSAHSSYFAILADLGLVGIILWAAVLVTVFMNLARAWRLVGTRSDSGASHAIQAIMFSFLLQIPYGFYAIVQKEKLFWIILGLSVVVYRLSSTQPGPLRPTLTYAESPSPRVLVNSTPVEHRPSDRELGDQ